MGGGKNSAGNAEQAALTNQGNINQQMQALISQLTANNKQFAQPLQQGLSTAYGGVSGAVGSGLNQGLGTALNSGGNLSGQTGVNQNQILQGLTGYASQPGKTNLAGATPGLEQFYRNEQQQGINPIFAQNAQNQLAQASAGGMTNILAHAAPGTNVNALMQNNQSQLLQNSANLQGNLAGQSQQFANQGAQGVANTAGAADSQKLGMLQAGNTAAQGGNASALNNLLSVLTQGQSALGASNTFAQQGPAQLQQAIADLFGIGGQYASQAANFGSQNKGDPTANMLGGLLGTAGGMMTGGAAGAGGLGNILGKL